jgi:hypothetical protein
VRTALGPIPHAGVPFVLASVNGAPLGIEVGSPLASGERARLELALPDDPALIDVTLRLRGGVLDVHGARVSWSHPLDVH